MTMESLAIIPRNKRPSHEDLDGYTESRYEHDTDYTSYRNELALWVRDYQRDEEQERLEQQGRTPLAGHYDDQHEQRHGYDPADFDLKAVASKIKSTPLH